MAKFNEIVYDIREYLKEFSDDTEVDDRHLMHLINIKRAKYLRQDLNNMQKTPDLSIQQSFCLELVEVSADECGLDITCDKILRTKKPLPKPIELALAPAITSIKPTNRIAIPFNIIPKAKVPYLQYAMFGNSIYAFLDVDRHIYFISTDAVYKLLDCVSVSGVFENPLDLVDYRNCCFCDESVSTCYDEMESEYPLQPHYIDLIKMEIVNELFKVKQVKEDNINDSTDEKQE